VTVISDESFPQPYFDRILWQWMWPSGDPLTQDEVDELDLTDPRFIR
jgi:hypothetical protein